MKKQKKPDPKKNNPLFKEIRDFIWIGVCIVIIYIALAPAKDSSFTPVRLADLQGVWTTSQKPYDDRFLEFYKKTITFGYGEAGDRSFLLDKVDSKPAKAATLVTITYLDMDGTKYRLNFEYLAKDNGSLRMNHPSGIIWKRADADFN